MLQNQEEDISLLDIQPPKIKYSKYAHSLDRLFKSASLVALQYNIKHPKTYKIKEFYEESKAEKKLDNPEYFKHLFEPSRDSLPQLERLKKNILTSRTNETHEKYNQKSANQTSGMLDSVERKIKRNQNRMKDKLTDYPEPGKYNPNYELIFKKSPAAVMHKPSINTSLKLPAITNGKDFISEKNFDTSKLSLSQHDGDASAIGKKNNAMKFSRYPDRKEEKRWVNPIISYLPEVDYMSNARGIDFAKMKPRSEKELVDFNILNNPSVGYYEPKYEYMNSQIKGVMFSPRDDKKITSPSKQYLVKKLWRSYENPPEYRLVKF